MSSLITQSNPAQSGQPFSFLSGAGDNATRNAAAGPSFSQMLKGQLDAGTIERSATAARERGTAQSASPSASPSAAPAREPQRNASRTPQPERSATTERDAGGGSAGAADGAPAQAETAPPATDAAGASETAAAAPAEPPPATPGDNPLAGLPATIAALLQKTAAVPAGDPAATANTTGEDLTGTTIDPTLTSDSLTGTAADMTDDTLAKSLQNSPLALIADTSEAAGAQTTARFQVAAEPASAYANRPASAQPALPVEASGALPGAATLPGLRHHTTQPAVPQLPVTTPAGQQAWADEVGNRVMWMVGRAESKAELVLTPPSLGKLEITISLNGDQTTAQFVAASQAARDALEQAMPKLREILAQSGISLGQADVSTSGEQQAAQEEAARRGSGRGGNGFGDADSDGGEAAPAQRWIRQSEGMVDTFA